MYGIYQGQKMEILKSQSICLEQGWAISFPQGAHWVLDPGEQAGQTVLGTNALNDSRI